MNDSVLTLTQSKYYSPALNTAIFDGPFRIYFAQNDEEVALKVYCLVQQKLGSLYERVKNNSNPEQNIFIVLHPEDDIFNHALESEQIEKGILKEDYNSDPIFVLDPKLEDRLLDPMFTEIKSIVQGWKLADSDFI